MFNIGDTIIYSVHGLCQIDDICEKTYSDVTRNYYVLHPLSQTNLTISVPVDSDKVIMLETMNREQAEEILKSFNEPGILWVEDVKKRKLQYNNIVKTGDRREIAKIANSLMRKNLEYSLDKKRMYDQDRRLLSTIQDLLFKELANSLDRSFEDISAQVDELIQKDFSVSTPN
ncbi:MAG: CarD family transcriptional regulator [Bacillus sp. (in: firmicutes)]